MAMIIADTACVDPRASLGDDVVVGPFCVIGPTVRIGPGTRLIGHVCVLGSTAIGARNVIHPFVVLGSEAAPIAPGDPEGHLEIGDENQIREHVSIAAGTVENSGGTRLGHRNLVMPGAQLGHDSHLGDQTTIGNNAVLADGVRVDTLAVLSTGVTIHRRVRVGESSFAGVQARLHHDVPPFVLVDGDPARVRGINLIGLKRRGLDKPGVDALREAHRLLYRDRMDIEPAIETLASHGHLTAEVEALIASLRAQKAGRHGRALEESGDGADPL